RVRVDQDDLVALLAEGLAGLGAGVVEFAGLADDDGAGADQEDFLQVGALRHRGGVGSGERSGAQIRDMIRNPPRGDPAQSSSGRKCQRRTVLCVWAVASWRPVGLNARPMTPRAGARSARMKAPVVASHTLTARS